MTGRGARWSGVAVVAAALTSRLAVVAWAASRIPPVADGDFYHRIGERIAAGLGYTWLWPDGAVTYAAHYPVGYPALIGAAYALVGPTPAAAMAINAVLGAAAALAVHRLAARAGSARTALLAGLLVAAHPGLVWYTPALMTEGVAASLVACAAWAAAWGRDAAGLREAAPRVAVLGAVLGAATLVRPQSLLLAPVLGALALVREGRGEGAGDAGACARKTRHGSPRTSKRAMLLGAAAVTAVVLLVCAPWTARNCVRMRRCALVSVNAGWNLLIGADAASTGAWSPVRVPPACREVWGEAEKDACFGREARGFIAAHPGTWLALVPRKLAATFDYCGAAPWYLHEANPRAFGEAAKLHLAAAETLYERLVLLGALVWAVRAARSRPTAGAPRLGAVAATAVGALGGAWALTQHGWVAHAALVLAAALRPRALAAGPTLASAGVAVLAATMATHAAFFGAGRYALLTMPLLCGLAALGLAPRPGAAPGRPPTSGATREGAGILGPS